MIKTRVSIDSFDPAGPIARLWLPPRFRRRQSETEFKQRWTLTLAQYAYMMQEFSSRRRQCGFIVATAAYGAGGGFVGNVVITDHDFTAGAVGPADATATVRWHTDGRLELNRDPGSDDFPSGEWWDNEPATGVGSEYEVRALSAGKVGSWTTSAAADNVWITMTANRDWANVNTGSGEKVTAATFQVGPDGEESADDSGIITARAEVF